MSSYAPRGALRGVDGVPGTLALGRLRGVQVRLRASWFGVVLLIAVLAEPWVARAAPDLGAVRWAVGAGLAVLLYLAVLVHELAHAVAARRYGRRVESITLSFLGGHTVVGGEPESPAEEVWVAVVGPLASLAVGAAAGVAWLLTPPGPLALALAALAVPNLLFGVLNLLPALPLDGGRMLTAAVWAAGGSRTRGVIAAGWAGRVLAGLVLLYPVLKRPLTGVPATALDYLVVVVLAGFLVLAANAEMRTARARARIDGAVARRLSRPTLILGPDTTLVEAAGRLGAAPAGACVLVLDTGGNAAGVLDRDAARAVPPERRAALPLASVCRTVTPAMRLPADLACPQLLEALDRSGQPVVVLEEPDGTPAGVLLTEDVAALLAGRRPAPGGQ